MKSMMILVLLASAPAMAVSFGDGSGDPVVANYLSWCDGNSVIAQDPQGTLYVRANCDEGGLQCKTTQVYRSQGSEVSATCVQK